MYTIFVSCDILGYILLTQLLLCANQIKHNNFIFFTQRIDFFFLAYRKIVYRTKKYIYKKNNEPIFYIYFWINSTHFMHKSHLKKRWLFPHIHVRHFLKEKGPMTRKHTKEEVENRLIEAYTCPSFFFLFNHVSTLSNLLLSQHF